MLLYAPEPVWGPHLRSKKAVLWLLLQCIFRAGVCSMIIRGLDTCLMYCYPEHQVLLQER